MSTRTQDISHVEEELERVQKERDAVLKKFETYSTQVRVKVDELLKEAGIYDSVHEMEVQKAGFAKQVQEKVNGYNTELARLVEVRKFLLDREGGDKEVAPLTDSDEAELKKSYPVPPEL